MYTSSEQSADAAVEGSTKWKYKPGPPCSYLNSRKDIHVHIRAKADGTAPCKQHPVHRRCREHRGASSRRPWVLQGRQVGRKVGESRLPEMAGSLPSTATDNRGEQRVVVDPIMTKR